MRRFAPLPLSFASARRASFASASKTPNDRVRRATGRADATSCATVSEANALRREHVAAPIAIATQLQSDRANEQGE
jgi:hypothetical protein